MSNRPPTNSEFDPTPTPITEPGSRGPMADLVSTDDTGQHRSDDAVADRAAKKAVEEYASNGNGGPPIDLKKMAKKNWAINTVIAAVAAVGTGFGGYKVLQSTVADHGSDISENKKAIKDNTESIIRVQHSVEHVGEVVEKQTEAQEKVAVIVEKLTLESKTRKEKRMKEEIVQLKKDNARLIRARNLMRPR